MHVVRILWVSNYQENRGSRVCLYFFLTNYFIRIFLYYERKGVVVAFIRGSFFNFILAVDQIFRHFFFLSVLN